jgi:hypothetical protein
VLVKALARAWRWQKLLDRGVYSSVTEIAEAERISKSYVGRILRLALLAPDLVEAILGGWVDQRVMLEELERPLPVGWEEQRAIIAAGHDDPDQDLAPCVLLCGAQVSGCKPSSMVGISSVTVGWMCIARLITV